MRPTYGCGVDMCVMFSGADEIIQADGRPIGGDVGRRLLGHVISPSLVTCFSGVSSPPSLSSMFVLLRHVIRLD
ncbi:hypothetical protein E2C01_011588 [Portunus trituberculatus]|uniref:Uncharacterized protein n=1 Tax=Portunus trituberculatus TaxID=210409 RepID=A0A5B7DBJ5_PORTR|nr:hypothetical protein [Portunus trituberculatus]